MKSTNVSFLKLQPLEDVSSLKTRSTVTSPLAKLLSPASSPKHKDMFIGVSPKVSLNMSMNFANRDSPDSSPIFSTTQSMSPDFVRGPRKKILTLVKPRRQRVILNSVSFAVGLPEDNEENDTHRFKTRLFTPVQEEKVISGDDDQIKINGEDGSGKFYSDYHKLDKIADINNFNRVQNAPHTAFLKKSEDLGLLPTKLGFLNKDGSKEGLKINHYRLGDKYASILSEGLKTSLNFNKFELSHNRLTGPGANVLLSAMTNGTEMIDLSGNNIGKMGCAQLCQVLKQRNQRLREINLEGNKLGDYAISELCEAIAINTSIKKINLNKNSISNKAAESIGKMLDQNSSLEELYLSWNQIRGQGGAAIFEGLKTNTDLRVLDLSWNSIGLNYTPFVAAFHEVITKNKLLVHLDLSNNCFKKEAAMEIAKSLESNHSLYGFHFQGNVGYVDAKGFLVVSNISADEISSQAVAPRIQGISPQPESLKRYHQNTNEFKDACWICEGWRPIEVKWQPGVSGDGDQDPVYVHFSYEGYRGRFLPKNKGFKTVRMAPPVAFKYLYTVDNLPVYAEGQPACQNVSGQLKLLIDNKPRLVRPEFTNCLESVLPQNILDEEFKPVANLEKYGIKPRIPDEVYIPPEIRVERPVWRIPISMFKEYRPDTQALLDKCFEVDFECTRISKIVKNEEDLKNVRDLLYSVYKNLKDCYKYFAAVGAPGEIWSIPLNAYTDFASNTNMIDGKILRLADFDRIFIATYTRTDKERNPRNPDRAVVRYQFMEGLVRLADYKFINSGLATTFYDALKMLMDDHVKPYIAKFDHQKWRNERYWNEEVDTVLKSYCPVFKGAYKKFSGLKTLPGQKKFMSLEEFYNLMNEMAMFNDNCGDRDTPIAYNLAMMTQIDELESDRIFQMAFVEFLEAFARMADKYSAAPIGKIETEMSYEERAAQPLHIKIEGLIQRLFNACGAETREVWILPETSVFELEEVTGKQRYNTKKKKIVRVNPTHPDSADAYDV